MKLAEIARALDASVEGDPELEIDDLQPLDEAGPRALSFVSNQRYVAQLATTRAGAVILGPGIDGPGCAVLRVRDAYVGFAQALGLFDRPTLPALGVSPAAHLAATARIGAEARIAPGVVIGDGVAIGARACLHPGVVVYPDSTIGDDFTAHANVVVRERVRIGSRVTLGPGVVIGGDGFGFLPLPGGGVFKLPQIGTVEIADDVEVGANTTVDRATIGATRLARGVKLDNLVMVAHGCRIGEESLLAARAASPAARSSVAASSSAARSAPPVTSRSATTSGSRPRAASTTTSPPAASIGGYPEMDIRLWRRIAAAVQRLPELFRRVRRLERALGADGDGGQGAG